MPYNNAQMKDGKGRWRTMSLFWEHRYLTEDTFAPLFSLKDDDHVVDGETFPSLRKLYMAYDHIPGFEYDFANEILGGWFHWEMLVNNRIFSPIIKKWREEKEIQIKANALKGIISAASKDSKDRQTAAKFIMDSGWKGVRGRPSKEETERQKRIAAGVEEEVKDDLARLGLVATK